MNHSIGLDKAKAMTQRYKENRNSIVKPEHQGKDLLLTSETFDREPFDQLLKQQGCSKIRIYFGMSEDLKVRAIIVGVDANGKDMLPASGTSSATATTSTDNASFTSATDLTTDPGSTTITDPTDPIIIEEGQSCPPICSTDSPLSSYP
jgi:hypothetical protein